MVFVRNDSEIEWPETGLHVPENTDESNQPQTGDNPNEVTGIHN